MSLSNKQQKLIKLFYQGEAFSTKDIEIKFDVSQRTAQNYIRDLKYIGLEKRGTKYFLPNQFRGIEIHQSVKMQTALMISLSQKAIPQLKQSVKENFKELPKELDIFLFDISLREIKNENLFADITEAIISKIAIEFAYKNRYNKNSTKNVYPLKIANMGGIWYLLGYDLEDEKIKTFSIESMSAVTMLDESYLSNADMQKLQDISKDINSPWYSDDKKETTLTFTGIAKKYISLDESMEVVDEDGSSLKVKIAYYNEIELFNIIKRWLPDVVIEDKEIRGRFHKMLNEFLNKEIN